MVPPETPLNAIHLENMLTLTHAVAMMLPPMFAFYNYSSTTDDIVNHTASRILDQSGPNNNYTHRWTGQNTMSTPA